MTAFIECHGCFSIDAASPGGRLECYLLVLLVLQLLVGDVMLPLLLGDVVLPLLLDELGLCSAPAVALSRSTAFRPLVLAAPACSCARPRNQDPWRADCGALVGALLSAAPSALMRWPERLTSVSRSGLVDALLLDASCELMLDDDDAPDLPYSPPALVINGVMPATVAPSIDTPRRPRIILLHVMIILLQHESVTV